DVLLKASRPGVGSTFQIIIASGQEARAPVQSPSHEMIPVKSLAQKALAGMDILLVEDVIDNQSLFKHILASSGAHVDTALNGREGVSQALRKHYDVVLMD